MEERPKGLLGKWWVTSVELSPGHVTLAFLCPVEGEAITRLQTVRVPTVLVSWKDGPSGKHSDILLWESR